MKLLPLVAAAWLLAACAAPPTPPPPGATLENTEWRLTELGGRPALAGPSLRLEETAIQARGNTGCNNFFGRYEIDGNALRFGPVASTRRACADDTMNRQESAFLKVLGESRTWRITGDTLILGGEAGELARFAAQRR